MGRIVAIVLLAGTIVPGAAALAPFTPNTLAGTWNGTWKNERFGSTGPAKIVVKSLADNTKLLFSINFGGTVFGCPSVPPESTTPLSKGQGANHWSAGGFAIGGKSKDFGLVKIAYQTAGGRLTGVGTNPPCAGGLSWSIAGKFSGNTFTGKVNITLADKSSAISDISLTR